MRIFLRSLAAVAACAVVGSAMAQSYPNKPIRLVVPYPPGASTDHSSRLIAERAQKILGQHIIIDNRGGASGTIGSDQVSKADPDGYTFVMGTDGSHATSPHLVKAFPYDPIKDFTPITLAVKNIVVLVANPQLPADNMQELIDYARKNPGKLSYGSSGIASPHFLAGQLLNQQAGLDLLHVPYRGGGPALVDVVGGQIMLVFASLASAEPLIKSGKVKVLGVTEAERFEGMPEVPAIAETLPGYQMDSWLGYFGPPGLPDDVLNTLNKALVEAVNDADVREKLLAMGLVPVANSPEEFRQVLEYDVKRRGDLIRSANIQPE